MHDIGKIGIPDAILLKEGPLTDSEWQEMRTNPEKGRGIDPGATEILFDTLGQVRANDAPPGNEAAQALGLGLPLSRLIVSAHSGRLGVESAPGAGSTFWIRLPLASAEPSGAAASHSSASDCPV